MNKKEYFEKFKITVEKEDDVWWANIKKHELQLDFIGKKPIFSQIKKEHLERLELLKQMTIEELEYQQSLIDDYNFQITELSNEL